MSFPNFMNLTKFPNFMNLTKFPNSLKLIIQINLLIQLGFFPKLPKYHQPIKILKLRTKLIRWSRKSLPRRK